MLCCGSYKFWDGGELHDRKNDRRRRRTSLTCINIAKDSKTKEYYYRFRIHW